MKLSLFNFTFLIIGKKKKRFWSEACQPVTDRDTLVVSRVGMKDTVPTFFFTVISHSHCQEAICWCSKSRMNLLHLPSISLISLLLVVLARAFLLYPLIDTQPKYSLHNLPSREQLQQSNSHDLSNTPSSPDSHLNARPYSQTATRAVLSPPITSLPALLTLSSPEAAPAKDHHRLLRLRVWARLRPDCQRARPENR